jgi:uncharacterized protein YecA (UPF0149 family)
MGLAQSLKKLILGGPPEIIPDLGRNDLCWCGSGKKYKKCHMASDEEKRSSQRAAACRAGT